MDTLVNQENEKYVDLTKDELDFKIEIATQTLERNISFIASCDNKTSIVLTSIGVLLTIILTNDGLNEIFDIINTCLSIKTYCNLLYALSFAISIVVLGTGIMNLGRVLIAKVSEEASGIEAKNSRIFFSGIIKNGDFSAYRNLFCSMTKQELLEELIAQIYINANIATQKYKDYNLGLKRTIIGFLMFIALLLIGIYLY